MARERAKSVKRRTSVKPLKRRIRARVRGATLELLEPLRMVLRDGEEVTITVSENKPKPDWEAFRRAAGSWKGNVDAGALIKMIYASRLVKSKRPIPRF
jgi:hypothetical protein